jgi:WhiB family redox-sensing transcriptional regulator
LFALTTADLPDLQDAACQDFVLKELFFPETVRQEIDTLPLIKKICDPCVERQRCLQYSLDHEIEFGFWGGLSPAQRELLQTTRARKLTNKERIAELLDIGLTIEDACSEVGILVESYRTSLNRKYPQKNTTQHNTEIEESK